MTTLAVALKDEIRRLAQRRSSSKRAAPCERWHNTVEKSPD